MYSQEYDEWESCRDGCGCDMFCRREMADPAWRKKNGFADEEEENMGFMLTGYGQNAPRARSCSPVPPRQVESDYSGQVITLDDSKEGQKMATVTNKKKSKPKTTTQRLPTLLEIVSPPTEPDVIRLKDLAPGEMFRYPAGNPVAIYMVQDLSKVKLHSFEKGTRMAIPETHMSFIALGSGRVFIENMDKVIIPVLGTLEYKDS